MPESLDTRAKRVFDEVLDLSGPHRSDALARFCAGAPELRARVEVLLAGAEKADAFLRDPTVQVAAAPPSGVAEQPGSRIGRYVLLEQLGEGGFGVVFRAEQTTPVRREVALKVIKTGMDTRQVIARFEAERQALALMDHPNIAKVFDAGATDAGRPYFVMELVRGEPVTRYCDRARLPLVERLQLFCTICGAVQHAHQKGVIHRDLKPSNILVHAADAEQALAKVIDFGISKATAGALADVTIFSSAHQVIGTPQYMSPEQAGGAGEDIDTRADIYSLGVLLYELLTGTTPFDQQRLAASGLDGMLKIIRDEEPPRPSARVRDLSSTFAQGRGSAGPSQGRAGGAPSSAVQIADVRGTEPVALVRTLRRDLDWIVLKCIEKDRARRYDSASALAEDIRRYLHHQPVHATPPSTAYKLRKFVRRNRAAVLAGGVTTAALVSATVVSIWFGISEAQQRRLTELEGQRAQRAEADARERAAQLERVAQFQERQLAGINPHTMGAGLRSGLLAKVREAGRRGTLPSPDLEQRVADMERLLAGSDFTGLALETLDRNFFDPAKAAIDREYRNEPLVQARLLQAMAATQRDLGLLQAAVAPQQQALAIRKAALGDQHPDTIQSLMELAALFQAQGKLPEAEQHFREALQTGRTMLGEDHVLTLRALTGVGKALVWRGKLAEAEPYWREALEKDRRVLGDDDPRTIASLSNIGTLLHRQGKFTEAEPCYREVLEKRRRLLGAEDPQTLLAMNNLAFLLKDMGRFAQAEELAAETLATRRRVLGNDHTDTLSSLSNMGMLLYAAGEPEKAGPYLLECLETCRRVLGNEHPRTLNAVNNVGALFKARGQLAAAEPFAREVLETSRRVLGDEHTDTLIAMNNMAWLLTARGEVHEAEAYYCEALETHRRVLGVQHPDTLNITCNIAGLLLTQDRVPDAIELLAMAEPAARGAAMRGDSLRLLRFLIQFGRARIAAHQYAAAETCLLSAFWAQELSRNPNEADRVRLVTALVELYESWHAHSPDAGHDREAAQWRSEISTSSG